MSEREIIAELRAVREIAQQARDEAHAARQNAANAQGGGCGCAIFVLVLMIAIHVGVFG